MTLTAGTKFGPYEIVAPLGAGGMGEVYRALDTRLDRTVAVKILPEHLSGSPEARQRFDREARAISSLSHPNICHLYDVGEQDGTGFLVMEYLEGEPLSDRLRKGALSLDQILKVGSEICKGLEKAHRSGVVHRDLKPGNIMLTKSGAKLMDFGLAKAPSAAVGSLSSSNSLATMSKALTTEGTIVGTIQYMCPEQLEGREADARSDIFSLGAVLYEMTTGKRAFEGKTTASTIAAILAVEPTPISTIQPMLPQALDHIIKACLAKDPDERFQTAHDVDLQLGWVAEGKSQLGIPAALHAGRNRAWITGGVAVLALWAGLALAHFNRNVEVPPVIRSSIVPPEKATFAEGPSEWAPPVLSPDGSRIVVGVTSQAGQQTLYVRSLNALTGQMLPGTGGAVFPFWSPDGHTIAFFANGLLKTIDASGGPVHDLCPAPQPRGGTWNQEGVIVFSPSPYTGLFRVAASGGPSVPLTKLDIARHEDSHRWPEFLPDGRHFIYLGRTSDRVGSEIRVAALDSPEQATILRANGNPIYVPSGFLLFPRGNALVAQRFDADHLRTSGEPVTIANQVASNDNVDYASFTASSNGLLAYTGETGGGFSELVWSDRTGKVLGKVGEPALYFGPSLSPDGQKLAVAIADPHNQANSEIWIYDLVRNSKARLTFSDPTTRDNLPVWSPDGSQVAFTSDRSGQAAQIYEKAVNGMDPERVVAPGEGYRYPSSWSPDGRYVVGIQQSAQGGTEFLVLPMDGTRQTADRLPAAAALSRFTFPRISPNGKWLAYSSFETGSQEVYLLSFPSGSGRWQVSTDSGTEAHWRRDGKELFYSTLDGSIMSAEISERDGSPVVGKPRALFQKHARPSPHWTFDVSPDGQRFLINTLVQPSTSEPITLVTNWDVELKKK